MATEILMPKLGATMERGTIIRWLKEEGEPVNFGEVLIEIMTDKINIEVEAETSGVLLKKLAKEDEEVEVHSVIAYIGQPDEAIVPASEAEQKITAVRATPASRRLARDHRLDLQEISGTGPKGRIQRIDVKEFLAQRSREPKITPLAGKMVQAENLTRSQIQGTGVQGKIVSEDVKRHLQSGVPANAVKMDGIRKAVAKRMSESAFNAPHVTLVSEADMVKAIELREQLLPLVEKETGYRLSYTEIIMKATAQALRRHPSINVSLEEDSIIYHSQVHIGLAVAIPNGLVVPVVRDCEAKGLAELTKECKTLTKMAQERKLGVEQMSEGTFTISNLGMYAVDSFTPIINPPESAILGVGRIQEKPVGVNGTIQLRPMVTVSLSFDHRVIDGAPAAAFLTELKEILENPLVMLA